MGHTTTSFMIAYDGIALRTHSMDVRDLAPALLSFGQLFDETNRILNGDKVSIKVHVKALKSGSFEIHFEAAQNILSQMTGFLTGDFVTSVNNMQGLIWGGCATSFGIIKIIKKLKGQKPHKIKNLKDGQVMIENDEETFVVSLEKLRLLQNPGIRTALEKIVHPLENEGIDTLIIKENGQEVERVDRLSAPYFKVPPMQNECVAQYTHDGVYSIISLAFKEENKWRLYDGNATMSATILDEDFLKQVDQNLQFSKGDILICTVRISQWQTDSGLKNEYEVLKVKEHRSAERQIPLF